MRKFTKYAIIILIQKCNNSSSAKSNIIDCSKRRLFVICYLLTVTFCWMYLYQRPKPNNLFNRPAKNKGDQLIGQPAQKWPVPNISMASLIGPVSSIQNPFRNFSGFEFTGWADSARRATYVGRHLISRQHFYRLIPIL